jgi:cytochrome c biogenesis protein ResB
MDQASEALLKLKPVTFRYNEDLDPDKIPQFGLVAEQVEKVNPDLVVRDEEGKPTTVRYDAVNAMLLNEFLKEHRKVEEQRSYFESKLANQQKEFEAKFAQQQKQIDALTTGLQGVSSQLEVRRPAPQLAVNNQ